MQRYLLGVDLGSSSIRAAVYTLDGSLAAIASRPTEKITPDPSRPGEIVWPHEKIWGNGCAVIREALAKLPPDSRIEGVAVACLGMDGLPIDADGRELYPFISWHDSRTAALSEQWQRDFGDNRQFYATGNKIFTFNTAFRLQWMAEHEPEILERTHKWVLIGDYFNFKLCGRLATDHSMANCTLLFDPRSKQWLPQILAAAGIDGRLLCDPLSTGTVLGGVSSQAAAETGLPEGTPVVLGAHDYLCGVLPVGGHRPGTIVNVAGTWDIVQTVTTGFEPTDKMTGKGLTYECHAAPDLYSIHGGAISGGVLEWYRSQFGAAYADKSWDAVQAEALEQRGADGLLFLPHIAGASCPDLDTHAAGALVGLRSSHSKLDILAAVCRGLAFQNAAIVQTFEECGISADHFVLVGGGARVGAAVQMRADVLGRPVEISPLEETTALGAAMIAGVGVGLYDDLDQAYNVVRREPIVIKPDPRTASVFARARARYSELYRLLRPIHHDLANLAEEAGSAGR